MMVSSKRRGAPDVGINPEKLERLLENGFSVSQIAVQGLLGKKIHRNTINNFMLKHGIKSTRARFSTQNYEELKANITNLNKQFPKSGYREMQALLKTQNPPCLVQREKVRKVLAEVDPAGSAKRLSAAVKRRVYHVETPNTLWHLDTNHKLIRWNFVVHGCVDGYSRNLLILEITTNNLAKVGFDFFMVALRNFGIPSMIRVDKGGEFNHHETFMNSLDSKVRCLRGKSVHNVRIERLWRDCREKVLDKYINIFTIMEKSSVLDIGNDIHMFALHYVFQPRIESDLNIWQLAHNNHPIRTEKNKTPTQLWLAGSLSNQSSDSTAMRNLFAMSGEEREQIMNEFVQGREWHEPDNINYVLSRIPAPLSEPELQNLCSQVDPLSVNNINGVDIYGHVVNYIFQCLSSIA